MSEEKKYCHSWLDLALLINHEETEWEYLWDGLPTISCALEEGHDGTHKADIDGWTKEDDDER